MRCWHFLKSTVDMGTPRQGPPPPPPLTTRRQGEIHGNEKFLAHI